MPAPFPPAHTRQRRRGMSADGRVLVLRRFFERGFAGGSRGADLGQPQHRRSADFGILVFHGFDQGRDGAGIDGPDIAEHIGGLLADFRIGLFDGLQPVFDRLAVEILLLRHIGATAAEQEDREHCPEDDVSHFCLPLDHSMTAVKSPSARVPVAQNASRSAVGG